MQRGPSIFFGWHVVAVSFLIAVFAWGLGFYGPAVYVNELVKSRGWAVSVVSGAVTLHFLFSAALVVFLADAHARFGTVAVTRAGLVAFALGAMGFAHATAPWHLYVAALFTGAGWSATSGAAINTFVSPWFDKKRALALSHAYNGASIGGVLCTPLWVWLISRLGFEQASIAIGVTGAVVLWILAGYALRPTPASKGVCPDNAEKTIEAPTNSASPPPTPAPPRHRGEFFTDPRFLTLSIGFAIGIFAQIGLITHLVVRLAPVLGDFGAASALSLATACAIVGRFGLAGLLGEHGRRQAAALNFSIQACGVLLLIFGTSPLPLLAGCVLFGLGIGNLLSLPPLILQVEQAPVDVGRALALLTAINQLVFAFAPGTFGALRDWSGGYTLPFALTAVIQILSAFIVAGPIGRSARP